MLSYSIMDIINIINISLCKQNKIKKKHVTQPIKS